MRLKYLADRWERKLKEIKEIRINETNFKFKNVLAGKELLIEQFLADIYEE